MIKNAIILAAGKSSHFAPFTYEKPKGLFCVKGEILIERQILQLKEAGIGKIYVVVGYMKEKFFYLEQKFGVTLLINNNFAKQGNIYSLFVAKEYLSNSFICCADHYFAKNPFFDNNIDNHSYRAASFIQGKFQEFAITYSDANVITEVSVGGEDCMAMVGPAYFNESFSKLFINFLINEIDDFGVNSMFWEEFYKKHMNRLTLYIKEFPTSEIMEFDDIEDLRLFDSEFLMNVDSDIINNIKTTLNCNPNDINDISIISAGLTNVSFSFSVNNQKYVYRHPGGSANNLVDRTSELFAQNQAIKNNIDCSVIKMDVSGWKISHYIHNAQNCDFEKYDSQLIIAMQYLHKLHQIPLNDSIKTFDDVIEGKKLLRLASSTKGNLEKEFKSIIKKIDVLYEYIKQDSKRLGYSKVLCHNDTYEPNYLYDSHNSIYLIDWEYAGLNYPANDIACILCRYDWSDEQIERYLKAYVGRDLTDDEHRYYISFIPIAGFYWFCWGLYKGSVGDDDSFFFLPSYRNMIRFIDSSIESYKEVF